MGLCISIHTPTKGATVNAKSSLYNLRYFNPHSHEGSDVAYISFSTAFNLISIHTPTKGATGIYRDNNGNVIISIHTPTKGATLQNGKVEHQILISIHTPTKGATLYAYKQSRVISFQSTLPRRERQQHRLHTRMRDDDFNPHSHEGSD